MKRKARNEGFFRDSQGAALVEFTLVFPMILLFLAGLADLGYALHQQHVVQKSVRDAARYAARTPYAIKACPLSGQSEWSQMVSDAKTIALHGTLASGAALKIPTWTGSRGIDLAITDSCVSPSLGGQNLFSPAGGGTNIPIITVTASAPYAGVGFLSLIGLSSFEVTASHSEMWVGL